MLRKLTCIILLIASQLSYGKIDILLLDLEGWTTPDGLSKGNKLLDQFIQFTDLDINVIYLPNARAINSIKTKNFHCIFTGSIEIFKKYTNREAIGVENIQTNYWRYISTQDKAKISSYDMLFDKDILALNGLILDKHALGFEPKLANNIDLIGNFQTIKRMLKANRADVGYVSLERDEQVDGFHYDNILKTLVVSRGLNCAKDYDQAQYLIDDFKLFLTSINYKF